MTLRPGAVVRSLDDRLIDAMGGPERRRVVLLLTAVLSLSSADTGAIGALAPQMERSFHFGNVRLGLLVTVSSLVGAVAALPMGTRADRTDRVRLLVIGVALWAGAMAATGLAVSFTMLLLTRLALGIVTAVAGPVIPSLSGDLFPAEQRSRIYGYLLTGDLLGGGAGLLVAANLGAAFGWRVTFFFLAAPSLALAVLLHRLLPEPARTSEHPPSDRPGPSASVLRGQVAARGDVEADPEMVLTASPMSMSTWAAARYVLRVRSNRLLIVSSALGYFFFAGLRTFGVIFARGRFGISQGVVSLLVLVLGAGGVAGTLAGGVASDRLIRRGTTSARLLVSGSTFVAAALVLVPGFLTTSMAVTLPLFVMGAVLLSAPHPALDAARLDVVPGRLWGRAEAVQTFVKTVLESAAPLLFGFVSSLFGPASVNLGSGVSSGNAPVPRSTGAGLAYTFLVMLVPLALGGFLLLRGRQGYLRDVAIAGASEEAATSGRTGAAG